MLTILLIFSFQKQKKVMELVKGTESRLAMQNAAGVLEKVVLDKQIKDNLAQKDQIEDGFPEEIETNHDSVLKLEQNPERKALLKQIEDEIIASMKDSNDHDYDTFIPNTAKSAMQKFQMDEDF